MDDLETEEVRQLLDKEKKRILKYYESVGKN